MYEGRTTTIRHDALDDPKTREVIVVGGGMAGLSAAIYLGRAQRDTLVIDSGHSMAKWEPVVENYLGFPNGVAGKELLKKGCRQAKHHEVDFVNDEIRTLALKKSVFVLKGKRKRTARGDCFSRRAFFTCRPRFRASRNASDTACFSAKIAMDIACAGGGSPS